jgi:hypothetical protein
MSLLIKPKSDVAPVSKPTLQEQTNGFKFQLPKTNGGTKTNNTPVVERPTTQPVATKPDKPDGNKLLIGTAKPLLPNKSPLPIATKLPQASTAVPEMSDDKYEVVAGSIPEFSEEAGNKFQQQLEMLQFAIDGNGVLKDQLANILTFLDDNPEYKDNISPKDVSVFIAGCRKVAGITVTEKVTRAKKVTKTTADVQDVLDDLADLSFDL